MTETSSSILNSQSEEYSLQNITSPKNSRESEKIMKEIANQDLHSLENQQKNQQNKKKNTTPISQKSIPPTSANESLFTNNSSLSGYQNLSQLVADFEKASNEADKLTEENKKLLIQIEQIEQENRQCIQENDDLKNQMHILTKTIETI